MTDMPPPFEWKGYMKKHLGDLSDITNNQMLLTMDKRVQKGLKQKLTDAPPSTANTYQPYVYYQSSNLEPSRIVMSNIYAPDEENATMGPMEMLKSVGVLNGMNELRPKMAKVFQPDHISNGIPQHGKLIQNPKVSDQMGIENFRPAVTKKEKIPNKKEPEWWAGFGSGHFTWVIPAKRRSGKTRLLRRLLKRDLVCKSPITGKKRSRKKQFFQRRILVSPTSHLDKEVDRSLYDEVYDKKRDLLRLLRKFTRNKEENENTLLVLDDVIGIVDHDSNAKINQFASRNRHYNVSLLIATQTYKSVHPTLRINVSQWCFFRVLNKGEKKKIRDEIDGYEQFEGAIPWKSRKFSFLYLVDMDGPRTLAYEKFDRYLGEVDMAEQ